MANFYEQIAQLGGMIKLSGVDLLKNPEVKPQLAKLKDGSSLNTPLPRKSQLGEKEPLFTNKMNDHSPYAKT